MDGADDSEGTGQLNDEDRKQKRLDDGIGIQNIILDIANQEKLPPIRVVETGECDHLIFMEKIYNRILVMSMTLSMALKHCKLVQECVLLKSKSINTTAN